ncbi:hypothetical protein C8Q69DRAFT_465475 [Paecilomyces variotii]|uniref:Uncharacterized protein n=1 Tax=Byssochlamys spectabilis TaxID=264951 RepID=A0A443HXL9_BYSSP|nr:hypothetical protein C8Q69DRAFT_465475 [Paecilomyces variotii]RWQ96484.1 hypothetical protein C8Q69DRAFT_465475 [Paecilomyces variotii]
MIRYDTICYEWGRLLLAWLSSRSRSSLRSLVTDGESLRMVWRRYIRSEMLVPGSEFLSSIILKSKKKSITTDKRTSTMADNTSGNQQEDYLDKGLDAVEKKYGGGKVDPEKYRSQNEKITDTARGLFEKATGKKIPEKFSN